MKAYTMGRGVLLLAALAIGLPTVLLAQQPQNRAQRGALSLEERQQLERRVRQQFDQRMRDEMGLTSDEQAQFGRLVQDFRDRRLELSLERRQFQVRLRREGRREDLTDDEASGLLEETLRLRDQESALFREEQEALLTILTPSQLVQLYQWREALTQRLRRFQGNQPGEAGNPGSLDWP